MTHPLTPTFGGLPHVPAPRTLAGEITLTQPKTGYREFEIIVNHAPFQRESLDEPVAREMLVWGDIDLGCNPKIQATEGTSRWIPYRSHLQLVASAGPGDKTINVKLRNDATTMTTAMTAKLTVGNEIHTSLLWSAYRRGMSIFAFSCSHTHTQSFAGLHYSEDPAFPDRIDLGYKGAHAAGEYFEFAVPPPSDSRYVVLIVQVTVGSSWYPPSTAS